MSRRNDYIVRLATAALGIGLAAGLLSGCGRRGPLEQPGPIFGGTARAAEQPAALPQTGGSNVPAPGGQAKSDDENEGPPTTRDVRDPAQVLTPAAQAPIPGAPDPLGPPRSVRSPY